MYFPVRSWWLPLQAVYITKCPSYTGKKKQKMAKYDRERCDLIAVTGELCSKLVCQMSACKVFGFSSPHLHVDTVMPLLYDEPKLGYMLSIRVPISPTHQMFGCDTRGNRKISWLNPGNFQLVARSQLHKEINHLSVNKTLLLEYVTRLHKKIFNISKFPFPQALVL